MSVVANAHNINLILNIPLKPTNCYFAWFRIITLPVRVPSDKFVQYSGDYSYIGLQHSLQAYILLTETDFNRCKKGTLTMCLADIAVSNEQELKCEISLYSQAKDTHPLSPKTSVQPPDTILTSLWYTLGIPLCFTASSYPTLF